MPLPTTAAELRYYARRAGAVEIEERCADAISGPEVALNIAFIRELAALVEQAYKDGLADGEFGRT